MNKYELLSLFGNAVSPSWGKRRLKRFKTVNGKRFQLHATRGWKAV